MKKLSMIIIVLLVALGIFIYPSLSNTLYVATGFSAKNICSGHFVSGFNAKQIVKQALKPINNVFNFVDFNVDETNKNVTTGIFGLFERHAVYRPGIGCTLLTIDQDSLNTSISPLLTIVQSKLKPWPFGLASIVQRDTNIDYTQLDKIVDQAFSESEANGKRNVKAIAIVYKGKLIAEQYAEGVDAETPLLGWSMAKSVTSLQVGLLVKSGKINLYAPADVPLWKNPDDPRSKITLDQLMRMSSGLEFNETYGIDTDVSRMLSIEPNAGDYAANKPLQFAPDSHWSYSSGSTNIIAGIIKRTIGGDFQHYYEYAQRNLFHPLGIATAYQETDADDTFIGSSFFYTSARDWAKLGQLMLQNGVWNGEQLLPSDWVKYSSTATKTAPLNQYGAQFWLNAKPDPADQQRIWPTVPDDAYYMGGYQGQYVIIIPSAELVIVRLGFSSPGTNRGIDRLLHDTIAVVTNGQ